ncbi:mitochondrial fission ELM1 family protein [Haliea sp. E17]|uniref:mitochondrial fission ELM1 family protein n=1 Tax=Haliea sp. E17 TaxID=3401576 RepID=UPI003AADE9F5
MPVVWLIDAYRAGERAQVRALAEGLQLQYEVKTLHYRTPVVWPHVLGQASLAGISAASRECLSPPWPDLVISCGVRNEPVCRWLREQSGGRTRYVHVGRPWGPLESFDLVITTPQYRVDDAPHVLRNTLTLHALDADKLAAARSAWARQFEPMPSPRIAVLVGGDSGPFTLGPRAATRLAREVSSLALETGGSLLLSTSSRTRGSALVALADSLSAPHFLHRWRAGDPQNPYLGMLAWADRIVVTGDSIAMLSEACATGKPVQIFDLGGMREGVAAARDFRLGGSLYAGLLRWGWSPLSRDITLVHRQLCASGKASWLGEEAPAVREVAVGSGDLQNALAAVRQLLPEPAVPGPAGPA